MPPLSPVHRALRLLRTLYHLKPWQIAGRVVAQLRRRVSSPSVAVPHPLSVRPSAQGRAKWPSHDPWNTRPDLLEGRFRFLNRTEELGWTPDWSASHTPLLWQFNLHYFNYLHLLEPEERVALCQSWILSNRIGSVGWHPYPTSLRITNWCRAGMMEPGILESLYRQAAHLYRNVETYIYGNHLLENARALIFAGSYFSGQGEADSWLERGLEIYREQTKEQILPDGGHFERSPMYHALMLEGYSDVLNLLPDDHPDRSWLMETVRKMVGFLRAVTHPDGQLALFNDSTQEIALSPIELEAYATAVAGPGAEPRSAYPHSGYYIYRDSDLYLMIDAGPGGPDYLMAHAHADVFSFELSIGGVQFITDSGVYEYAAGEMRDYVRSTRAHNTVMVDGVDQIECWGSFRVGRREAPEVSGFSVAPGKMSFSGIFHGYEDAIGDSITHSRKIELVASKRTVQIEDVVRGEGIHKAKSFLHLHPEVEVETGEVLTLLRNGVQCQLRIIGSPVLLTKSHYCPQFGERLTRWVVEIDVGDILPTATQLVLQY